MAAVENYVSKNEVFLSDFSVNKSSKNQNFYIIVGPTVAIRVPDMYIKFREDREEERSTQHEKNVVLRKTRLKFFSMKNRKKIA